MIRIIAVWMVAAAALFGQPAFEVATVKPSTSGYVGDVATYPGGRVKFQGCTLKHLIQEAFDIQDFQVSGGPGWMETERWDIEAKPPASSKSSHAMPAYTKAPLNEEQRQMLESLLMERFALKYHRETREGPVYLLTRSNKPLKMTDAKDKNAYPWAGGLRGGMITRDGLAGNNESMEDLAWRLGPYMGRPVLDRTGISGSFDFRYEYQAGPDERPDTISTIMAAIEGIGLKLASAKGPVSVVAIDHAERPGTN